MLLIAKKQVRLSHKICTALHRAASAARPGDLPLQGTFLLARAGTIPERGHGSAGCGTVAGVYTAIQCQKTCLIRTLPLCSYTDANGYFQLHRRVL